MSEESLSEELRTDLPKYKCHKVVEALRIVGIDYDVADGEVVSALLVPYRSEYAGIQVDAEFVKKHEPAPGGYYVAYEDGYKSFSPQAAFEAGYSLMPESAVDAVPI